MVNGKPVKAVVLFLTFVVVVAVLALSVVTLIKVNRDDDDKTNWNPLNLRSAEWINSQSGGDKYNAFKDYVGHLTQSLNYTFDPCDDFYSYTCASFNGSRAFSYADESAIKAIIAGIKREQSTRPTRLAAHHFNACVKAYKENNGYALHKDGAIIKRIMNRFKSDTELPFPLLEKGWDDPNVIGADLLAKAMAHLSGKFSIETFVSQLVQTNYRQKAGLPPYALFLDQSTLGYGDTYYTNDVAWDLVKDDYKNKTMAMLREVAKINGQDWETGKLESDVDDIIALEKYIAVNINTKGKDRRDYSRQENAYKVKDIAKDFPIFDAREYLKELSRFGSQAVRDTVQSDEYTIYLAETKPLKKLGEYLSKTKPRLIPNYLWFRLIRRHLIALPSNHETKVDEWIRLDWHQMGKSSRRHWGQRPLLHHSVGASDEAIEAGCAGENAQILGYANVHFLLHETVPDEADRKKLRATAALVMAKTLEGFQTQLDQLNWMNKETKKKAALKISQLTRNVAYPDWALDEDKVFDYYKDLTYTVDSDYWDVITDIRALTNKKLLEPLGAPVGTKPDRLDFLASPSIVNAWYEPILNSITFPLGILRQPFFDVNYPVSVNYGGLGVIAGHELIHGFDDQGIQFNGVGILEEWIDKDSKNAFEKMAQCVSDEYSTFSPVENFYVNGINTLGENIADNGGIRAAWNAFQAHQGLYGPDPRLPDENLNQFTHEQLFFLSFARVWCEPHPSEERLRRQVLVDPHSPSKFRVFGTVQNFPAFRSAFNCPQGAAYAPEKHCDVWATEVKVVTGLPAADNLQKRLRAQRLTTPRSPFFGLSGGIN